MHFAEIGQRHAVLREPTVECQCVPYLDVNDARCELLVDQRCDKRTKMTCDRTTSTADERRGALIRSFHKMLLVGGSARQGDGYVRCVEHQRMADQVN